MNIIFFDGVCNLCNGFISFLVSCKPPAHIKMSSLQGECAKEKLSSSDREDLSSVIYFRDGEVFRESTAVLLILGDLKLYFVPLKIFLIIPSFLRDGIYKFIARNRYRLFGKKETCRLITPEEREYFLD